MRTVKESIEQTLSDAAHIDGKEQVVESGGPTAASVKKISERMEYCKNALRILQSDMQSSWVSVCL